MRNLGLYETSIVQDGHLNTLHTESYTIFFECRKVIFKQHYDDIIDNMNMIISLSLPKPVEQVLSKFSRRPQIYWKKFQHNLLSLTYFVFWSVCLIIMILYILQHITPPWSLVADIVCDLKVNNAHNNQGIKNISISSKMNTS